MERTSKKEIKSRMEKGMIPVGGNFDVVVVGGGFSGVAAAISAARMGKRVLLLEKRIMPGGLATAGIITHYLAICDGHGRKIIRGLGEELLHTAIRYSYDTLSEEWRDGPDYIEHPSRRYETWFSFPECAVALEELLLSEGVEILYDSLVSSVCMKNGNGLSNHYLGDALLRTKKTENPNAACAGHLTVRDNWRRAWSFVELSRYRRRADKPCCTALLLQYGF